MLASSRFVRLPLQRLPKRAVSRNQMMLMAGPRTISYSFSTHSILQDLNEIKEGQKFYEQLNLVGSEEMFERALDIVPFYMAENQEYNNEFQNILDQLIKTYAWKGNLIKIDTLITKVAQTKNTKAITIGQKIDKVMQTMGVLGRNDFELSPEKKIISELYLSAKSLGGEIGYEVDREITLNEKTQQPNTDNLESWIHGELRDTWMFVLLSLLSRKNIYSNPQYNKLCSSLLKNCERSSQKNVVKPLILLIANLLRNQQYLQAEGMLSYCLDRKKDNLKPEMLKHNQEYLLLNLLLAKTFKGVKRDGESQMLIAQNRRRFDLEALVLQGYLLDSV